MCVNHDDIRKISWHAPLTYAKINLIDLILLNVSNWFDKKWVAL